jgi:hypothetical protein
LIFRETLIYSILGTNQLAIREARLSDSPIFNGLQPSKMPVRSGAAGSAEQISASSEATIYLNQFHNNLQDNGCSP